MPKLLTILLTSTLFLSGCILVGQKVSQSELQPEQVATSTSDEIDTSDWKTYRNEEYGFEFRYPGNWRISYDKSDGVNLGLYENGLQISYMGVRLKNTNDKVANITEFAKSNCAQRVNLYCNTPKTFYFTNLEIYTFSKDNFFDDENDSEFVYEHYVFYSNGTMFEVTYSIADGDGKVRTERQMQDSNDEAKVIISSLKQL